MWQRDSLIAVNLGSNMAAENRTSDEKIRLES